MADFYDPDQYPESTVSLVPLNGTFVTKRIAIPDGKPVTFGRLPQDHADVATVPKFPSKVVSRQHCILFNQGGKFFIKDAGSSSGTFLLNAKLGDKPFRLSEQGKESSTFEVHDGDVIQLGEDYDQGGALHKCTQMRFCFPTSGGAGASAQYSASPSLGDTDSFDPGNSFIDYSSNPDVRREVEEEFNSLWASMTSPLTIMTPRGSTFQRKTSNDNRATIAGPPAQAGSGSFSGSPSSTVDGVNPNDCVAFIQSQSWESAAVQQRLVELALARDASILGFYRSLKQFPSAFKDVVTKYVQKKSS